MKNGTKVIIKSDVALVGGMKGVISDTTEEGDFTSYVVTLTETRGVWEEGDEVTLDAYEVEESLQ